eukprot:2095995-Pleurochrysis_carterae.AAC.1
MVSRLIISDAETRDFARQLSGAYMLLPHERLWENHTLISVREQSSSQSASSSSSKGFEEYRGRTDELTKLFRKIEVRAPSLAFRDMHVGRHRR